MNPPMSPQETNHNIRQIIITQSPNPNQVGGKLRRGPHIQPTP